MSRIPAAVGLPVASDRLFTVSAGRDGKVGTETRPGVKQALDKTLCEAILKGPAIPGLRVTVGGANRNLGGQASRPSAAYLPSDNNRLVLHNAVSSGEMQTARNAAPQLGCSGPFEDECKLILPDGAISGSAYDADDGNHDA